MSHGVDASAYFQNLANRVGSIARVSSMSRIPMACSSLIGSAELASSSAPTVTIFQTDLLRYLRPKLSPLAIAFVRLSLFGPLSGGQNLSDVMEWPLR